MKFIIYELSITYFGWDVYYNVRLIKSCERMEAGQWVVEQEAIIHTEK